MKIPDDIFTEPSDIDPDTLRHLGPLRHFPGIWEGHGTDIAPKAAGPETRKFFERMVMQPIDAQPNGPQLFYGLRYHTHITTAEEDITFHDQVGYWLWEPATGVIMQTLAIPRGQVALSSGTAKPDDRTLTIRAERGQTNFGICSNDFLEGAFRTDRFELNITFNDDGSWSYISDTTLEVKGQGEFLHRDRNTLKKVGEVDLNPWLTIERDKAKGGTAPPP